jgi:hypothetical protein
MATEHDNNGDRRSPHVLRLDIKQLTSPPAAVT